ncbi:LuxR C-terminal-related transcriptional regulator [Pseudomonas mohnii]
MHQTLDSLAGACGGAHSLPVQLTAKETQTLLWCFKGKTSWEIARIQNCSEWRSQGTSATPDVRCCHVYPIQTLEY